MQPQTIMTLPSLSDSAQAMTVEQLYARLQPLTWPASPTFWNWAKTFRCEPLVIFEPATPDDCRLILELARREQRRVRAAGVGHSPSDLACTTEFMLRTTKMNRLISVRLPASLCSPFFRHICH